MKLGLVTYNLAKAWDIETIISRCEANGFEAVELRTTHAHGVEVSLDAAQRAGVRRRFEDSGVRRLSLGSTCEYDSVDPEVVKANVALTKNLVDLAADIGAAGVKVRPNALHEDQGVSTAKTLEQIGTALRQCGRHAEDTHVSIWLEVHGQETQHPPHIRRIMEVADHPKVGVCWNSNMADVLDGSVGEYFELLRPWIMSVHINDLWNREYPYRELFGRLRGAGYEGYCLAEIADESCEPDTFMRYYAALFRELCQG